MPKTIQIRRPRIHNLKISMWMSPQTGSPPLPESPAPASPPCPWESSAPRTSRRYLEVLSTYTRRRMIQAARV